MGAAWLAIAAAIGSITAVHYAMNGSSSNKEMTASAALSTKSAQADKSSAYIGTSYTEPATPDRLDWSSLSN